MAIFVMLLKIYKRKPFGDRDQSTSSNSNTEVLKSEKSDCNNLNPSALLKRLARKREC